MSVGQLQEIFQKAHKPLPTYNEKWVGGHAHPLFECIVTFELTEGSYTSVVGTGPSKAIAKKNACETALTILLGGDNDVVNHKNLLQELMQKAHLELPKYTTNQVAMYPPMFQTTVTVTVDDTSATYEGEILTSKKMAEQSAAKTAYLKISKN